MNRASTRINKLDALKRPGISAFTLCFYVALTACTITPQSFSTTVIAPTTTSTQSTVQNSAGIVLKLTLAQLVERADIVAVGTVSASESIKGANGTILTMVTLSVDRTLKGQSGTPVVIRNPGGVVDGQRQDVEDAPQLQLHERLVVFLEKTDADYSVVGGFQGKFTIDTSNRVGGEPLEEFLQRIEQAAGQ